MNKEGKHKNAAKMHSHAGEWVIILSTGKSLSEALIFASINPQYDNRLFIEITMKTTSAEHGQNMFCPCSAYVLCL